MHQFLLEEYIRGTEQLDQLKILNESKYGHLDHIKGAQFPAKAHIASVNALALEKQHQRYLLSGGGDSSIKLWDLHEQRKHNGQPRSPVCVIPAKSVHKFGITHLKWWADNGMWLSSSYDYTLKAFNTETMQPVHSFNLQSRVANFDFDPLGRGSLVACCLDGGVGGVKLVDLRTLADSQTLGGGGKSKGGFGYMASCAWSPTEPNLVVSGAMDGYCIGWDIRASNACVFKLDYNLTTTNYKNGQRQLRFYEDTPRAHNGAVNSVMFNDTGTELITLGTDEKIRVWDLTTGNKPLNKSINFGPLVRNKSTQYVQMCLTPTLETEMQYLWFPSASGEMLVYTVQDGKMVARLTRRETINGPNTRMHSVVYGGNNTVRVYAGGHDGSISVWGYNGGDEGLVQFDNGVDYEDSDVEETVLDRIDREVHTT